jgi:MFS superfamily sulfate permease-like transporter
MALCRADRLDGLVALATFFVTLLVGPERGILAGVAAAALCYVGRARWRRGTRQVEAAAGPGARTDASEHALEWNGSQCSNSKD